MVESLELRDLRLSDLQDRAQLHELVVERLELRDLRLSDLQDRAQLPELVVGRLELRELRLSGLQDRAQLHERAVVDRHVRVIGAVCAVGAAERAVTFGWRRRGPARRAAARRCATDNVAIRTASSAIRRGRRRR